jgi:hypothetical protein
MEGNKGIFDTGTYRIYPRFIIPVPIKNPLIE